jgi:drug/metabolite transporter (DMT)-like permease
VNVEARPAPSGSFLRTHRSRRALQLAFAYIYLVWGLTFVVNRIMVLALPPLLAAGTRFMLSGVVLTFVARARGLALPARRRDWYAVAATAILGVLLANGLSVLALRRIASNQAALINASAAFWIAWVGMYGRRAAAVSARTWTGLGIGFAGVAMLVSAHGFGASAHVGWQLALLAATLCWALATSVMRESQSECDPLAFTACYLLLGGALLAAAGLAGGDAAHWTWSPAGIAAIVFLGIFSSSLGFVAYSYLLLHETPSRVGTYAYVNPLVAVVAGWLLLGERLDALQIAGSAVIFAGVVLVRNLPLLPGLPRRKRSRAVDELR